MAVMDDTPTSFLSSTPPRWLIVAGLLAVGGFLMFFELGAYRTLTKHESFVAVVSQEMLATGDYVVPRFRNLPRLKKPPLSYWSASASAGVLGVHNEFTVRLPSALAAILLAGLVGVWAGRWYGRPAGYAAALVQLSCAYVISFGRKAEVDMQLCLLTTTALFLIANYQPSDSRKSRWIRWTTFYGLIGLSWLAKFHYGPAMVLAVTAVWLLYRRWWFAIRDVLNPAGLALLVAAVVIWPYLLLQRVPEAWKIWQAETVGRALGDLGSEPFWFYVPQIAMQTLPWAPLLWWAIPRSYRLAWGRETGNVDVTNSAANTAQQRERFLWTWFGVQFCILTASAFKHHHYLMAALPALSLIIGRTLGEMCTWAFREQQRLSQRAAVVLSSILIAVGVVAPWIVYRKWPHLLNPVIAVGICLAVVGPLAIWQLRLGQLTRGFALAGVAAAAMYMSIIGWIFPGRDHRLPFVRFASDVRAVADASQASVCVFGLKEDPLVYYLDQPTFRVEEFDTLQTELLHRERLVIVLEKSRLAELYVLGVCKPLVAVAEYPDCPPAKGEPLLLIELTPHQLAAKGNAAPQ